MSGAGVHPVSSKEHMLNPTDIFAVAAHEDKSSQKVVEKAAKKAHVSTERMLYSVMIQEYSGKSLVRVRVGNTLFTIAAFAMTHTPEIVRVLKLAARKLNDPAIKTNFDSARGLFAMSTGEKRD